MHGRGVSWILAIQDHDIERHCELLDLLWTLYMQIKKKFPSGKNAVIILATRL
jgi:hypothetical protein